MNRFTRVDSTNFVLFAFSLRTIQMFTSNNSWKLSKLELRINNFPIYTLVIVFD